jgi:hypothetical protein
VLICGNEAKESGQKQAPAPSGRPTHFSV